MNLDKKLKDIVYGARQELLDETSGTPISEYVSQIKQAFIEDGWFMPSDTELVQQIMNFRAQAKQHDYVGPDTIIPIVHRTEEEIKAISKEWSKPRMTGQEWYSNYLKELKGKVIPFKGKTDDDIMATMMICEDAAKKAAGIE